MVDTMIPRYHGAFSFLTPTLSIIQDDTAQTRSKILAVSKGCRLPNPPFGVRGLAAPLRPRLRDVNAELNSYQVAPSEKKERLELGAAKRPGSSEASV